MNTLIKLTVLSGLMLWYIPVMAQVSPNESSSNVKSHSSGSCAETVNISSDNSAGGGLYAKMDLGEECSMYFNDWTEATVLLKDENEFVDRLVRYNIYNQQMEFIAGADTAAFGNPEEIKSISMDGHEFIFQDFQCESDVKKGYFEVLVEGDCKLLLHRCIAYRYVEECTDPNSNFVKEQYYLSKKYFISENEKTAKLLPYKKKELIAMLGEGEKDIKSYIKENKIKLCNEEDLKSLISYYNSD